MSNNAKHDIGESSLVKKTIFGTDGIRGNAKEVFKPELVLQIGQSCGELLSQTGPVLIGEDSRNSSSMITAALTAGLTAAGKEVWQIGICPTPAIPLLIKKFSAAGGLMVSASHNQPSDNGIKIFGFDGNKISLKDQEFIEERLQKKDFSTKNFGKKYQRIDLLNIYERSLLDSIGNQDLYNIPIVLDLCWGSATILGEKIFQALGAKVFVINGTADGSKINVGCGSTNLQPIQNAILENNAKMGFAFDGDADRVIAIDEKGRIMNGDHILYLWGSYLKAKNKLFENRLIATTMSNLGFEKAWTAKGGVMQRTKVGDKHVHKAMVNTKADLGGEQSGHILTSLNDLCGDGLLTALQMSFISKESNLNFSEWLDKSFTPYPQKLVNVPLKKKIATTSWKDSESFQSLIKEAKYDLGGEGRVLIRESGTEPLLRVMVESNNQSKVEHWCSKIAMVAASTIS